MTMLYTLVVALLAVLLASAVRRVPEGQVYSVHRHGKPRRLLPAGTHLVLPLLDRVAHKINLSGQTLQLQAPLGVSDVRGTVYWQVLEPERADAVFEQVDQLIRHGAQAVLRDEPATTEAVDRRDLGVRVKQSLNHVLRERGMMVTRVDLDAA